MGEGEPGCSRRSKREHEPGCKPGQENCSHPPGYWDPRQTGPRHKEEQQRTLPSGRQASEKQQEAVGASALTAPRTPARAAQGGGLRGCSPSRLPLALGAVLSEETLQPLECPQRQASDLHCTCPARASASPQPSRSTEASGKRNEG